MKSKLTFWSYLVTAGCIIQAASFPKLLSEAISGFKNAPFSCLLTSSVFLFIFVICFFGQLKTTIISVRVECDEIFVKRYCGLGITRIYKAEQISGFKTLVWHSRGNKNYEFLYLMINSKKIAVMSEFYHSNYNELKEHIVVSGVKYIGLKEADMTQEIKDVFS